MVEEYLDMLQMSMVTAASRARRLRFDLVFPRVKEAILLEAHIFCCASLHHSRYAAVLYTAPNQPFSPNHNKGDHCLPTSWVVSDLPSLVSGPHLARLPAYHMLTIRDALKRDITSSSQNLNYLQLWFVELLPENDV
jgi:hypothetical protein